MVDFAKLIVESEKKKEEFGRDLAVQDERKFMDLHNKICPGIFKADHDFGSFKQYSCSACPATFQKGTGQRMAYQKSFDEDMTDHFYGHLPEKLLQKHALIQEVCP